MTSRVKGKFTQVRSHFYITKWSDTKFQQNFSSKLEFYDRKIVHMQSPIIKHFKIQTNMCVRLQIYRYYMDNTFD